MGPVTGRLSQKNDRWRDGLIHGLLNHQVLGFSNLHRALGSLSRNSKPTPTKQVELDLAALHSLSLCLCLRGTLDRRHRHSVLTQGEAETHRVPI